MTGRAVDRLLLGYLVYVTLVMLAHGSLAISQSWWLIAMHTLFVILLYLFARLRSEDKWGALLYDVYPILLTLPLYWEVGILNDQFGWDRILQHGATVQGWETAIFGGQVSYEWNRSFPSALWAGVFHLGYLAYYPLLLAGPIVLAVRGRNSAARDVVYTTMLALVVCYVLFLLYPGAGPLHTLPAPTGPVREVWSARLVSWVVGSGGSSGTAFPSAHIAAAIAATLALRRHSRAATLAGGGVCVLLVLGIVYGQRHYAIDALAGLVVGLSASILGRSVNHEHRPVLNRRSAGPGARKRGTLFPQW